MNTLTAKVQSSTQHMVPRATADSDLPSIAQRYFREEVAGRSPHTLCARRSDLAKFFLFYQSLNGHLTAASLTPRDVKLFLNELEAQDYAGNSINRHLGSIRAFGSWLLENGVVRAHPCKGIRDLHVELGPPKAPRDREFHRLRKAADALAHAAHHDYSQGFRDMVLLETLNTSGLRISEVLNLNLSQFQGRKFHAVRCKGGKVRSVSIKTEVCDLIAEYIKSHRAPGGDFLFTSKAGGQLDRVSAWRSMKKIARLASAGLPAEEKIDLHPHALRHRHGFKCREAKDAVFAAARLGHSSLVFVQRYTQETASEERGLIEQIE